MIKIILVLLAGIFGASAAYAQFGGGMLIGSTSPPSTATLTASPSTVSSGSSSTLTWGSTYAPSCAGTGFSTGGAVSGSVSTGALTTVGNFNYSVNCGGAVASATVTVTGAAIACDEGPNTASIPAPAQAAGFTTCALNADFTTNTTDSHGVNWSDPNTWAANCGATQSNNKTVFTLSIINASFPVNVMACNRIVITSDGPGVPQVLYWNYNPATDYPAYDFTALDWPGQEWGTGPCVSAGHCMGGPFGNGLYNAFYAELTFRTTVASSQNFTPGSDTISYDWWASGCNGCQPTGVPPVLCEYDFFERNIASPTFHYGNIHCGGTGNNQWSFDDTVYHTVALLMTNDGTSNRYMCIYMDGSTTATQCNGTSSVQGGGLAIALWAGDNSCFNGRGCMGNPAEIYVKSLRVFACASYWSGICTGTVITH